MSSSLSILNDSLRTDTQSAFERFQQESVLDRLRRISSEHDLSCLPLDDEPIVALGTESNAAGAVTKNLFGVFDLSWQAPAHPEWVASITREAATLRDGVRAAHGTEIRFVIWAGMGGSVEDKSLYESCGLLKAGPRFYALDSTDPGKLKSILHDIHERSGLDIPDLLRSTLVVGMALGMTSYEPVVNLEHLAALYERNGIDPRPNFLHLALDESLLDQFGRERGLRRIPLQPDGRSTTAGRHSSPLTQGGLYLLALAGVDLQRWIEGTSLTEEEIDTAWKLAAFLHVHGLKHRDKVTLLLPRSWSGAGLWTKQDFEESLGKSEEIGIKIVIDEPVRLRSYRRVTDAAQDRIFLAVQKKGEANPWAAGISALRHAKYPLAVLTFSSDAPLSRYMQFMHFVVFGLAFRRNMNFVTQPGVELYKSIAAGIFEEAKLANGVEQTPAWKSVRQDSKHWRGVVSLSPKMYAAQITESIGSRSVEYAELTFFGDMRYGDEGQKVRKILERAGDRIFRLRFKMPVDIYEGPAMNHSYHEMIIGHGKCFSTILISERQDRFPAAGYEPDYHMAQFLATRMALERRGRRVVAVTVKDLTEDSLRALDEFFNEAAALV